MREFILGTDFWTDCDDAVAIRLLTKAMRAHEIRLLGVAINACMEYSLASLVGFLRADGVSGIPVGIDLDATDFGGAPPYQKRLAERFAPDVTNADAEDAVRLYRRLLAESEEGGVELIEIGYPQVLAALLMSNDINHQKQNTCRQFHRAQQVVLHDQGSHSKHKHGNEIAQHTGLQQSFQLLIQRPRLLEMGIQTHNIHTVQIIISNPYERCNRHF